MSLLRIFLLWEDFQPRHDAVSAAALANLETVSDLAAERGIGLDVTFFTGHMSGPNGRRPGSSAAASRYPVDARS